jgi:hypothetical protein
MRISILFCIGLLTCITETHASPEHLPLDNALILATAADAVQDAKRQAGVKAPSGASAAQLERSREQGRLLDEQILQLKQELLDLEKQKFQLLKLPQCPPLKQSGPEIQQAL